MNVKFSVKHQRWNILDHMGIEQIENMAFDIKGHELWAEIPDLGEGEG